ncbi:MAG: hypothetical protein ACLQAT_12735 [Candidatus Binataceae bacterium]
MKPAVVTLFVAIALFDCTLALAGSVEIGFVDDAGLEQWMAGGPAEVPTGETACTPAKFGETSDCRTVVIFNRSSQAITLRFTSNNAEFSTGMPGAFAMFGPGPRPCSAMNVHEHLEPDGRCYEPVEFWPRTGEARYGTIRVIVESSNGSASTYFKVKGTSDYPPELQAAEEVRQRHQSELKKIPQVASVELDNDDGIKIDVTVKDQDDVEDVRRLVPPKIEGYDTEVTQYAEHGYAF